MPLWEQVSLLHKSNQYEALASKRMQSAINFELNKIIPLLFYMFFTEWGITFKRMKNKAELKR